MLTTSNSISDSVVRKKINGINVIYLKVPYDQKMNIFERFLSFLKFMVLSTYHAYKIKNIDLVVATSTPLSVGFPAFFLNKINKLPYIFEVRDLWPEVPIQMGAIKNKLIINILRYAEKTIYKNSIHVVALSPGMIEGVLKCGISTEKTSLIPNMAKIDLFYQRKINYDRVFSFSLKKESFKVIHFGSIGIANGCMYIIEAAKLLKNNPDIEFVFIGGGAAENELSIECQNHNLNNVHFLGNHPLKSVSEIVNFCDVSIVSFKDLPILYTNSPNKLFDSLSAGRPIILNSNGWTRKLVEKNKCGFYVDPSCPNQLADKIVFLKNNPALKEKMGKMSRKLAEEKYDKNILCANFTNVIKKIQSVQKLP